MEGHVRRTEVAEEVLHRANLERCAVGNVRPRQDMAGEIAEKEVVVELRRQTGAGIVGETGGAVTNVRQRREQIRGCVRLGEMPESFAIPRTHLRLIRAGFEPLPADAPAEVRTLHDVMPAGLVAAIAVIVGGEEIAVIVERQLLRIAQSPSDDLEVAAVPIRTEDAARVGDQLRREAGDRILDLREEIRVRAAVGDGPVELAIGTEDKPVHVVSAKGDVDAEAVEELYVFRFPFYAR